MQDNIKNLVKKIAGKKNTANKVFNHHSKEEDFMNQLSQKSYYENNSLLYHATIFFAFISQLATAVSSYTFFADLLAIKLSPTLLPFAVAILLLLIEVLKYVSFNKGLEGVFALPQRINYVLLVFAILLSAGSMYASIIGGGSFGIDTQKIVSTETKFDGEIDKIRQDITDIKSRNTWKNQTWLPKKEKSLVYSKEEELTRLKLQKEQSLADTAADNETAATQYKFGFAFFDALFLLCTLYVWYFRKCVAVEGMVNESQTSSPPAPEGGVMQVIQPVITQPVTQQPVTQNSQQPVTQPEQPDRNSRTNYLKFTPVIRDSYRKKKNDDENALRTEENASTEIKTHCVDENVSENIVENALRTNTNLENALRTNNENHNASIEIIHTHCVDEKHQCENCGKIRPQNTTWQRFCCDKCRGVWNKKNRIQLDLFEK